jgi:hypothetical protein
MLLAWVSSNLNVTDSTTNWGVRPRRDAAVRSCNLGGAWAATVSAAATSALSSARLVLKWIRALQAPKRAPCAAHPAASMRRSWKRRRRCTGVEPVSLPCASPSRASSVQGSSAFRRRCHGNSRAAATSNDTRWCVVLRFRLEISASRWTSRTTCRCSTRGSVSRGSVSRAIRTGFLPVTMRMLNATARSAGNHRRGHATLRTGRWGAGLRNGASASNQLLHTLSARRFGQ